MVCTLFPALLMAQESPVTERLSLSYSDSTPGHRKQQLDLYLPSSPAARFPLMVFFHGGGLQSGDKSDVHNKEVARRFASQGVGVAMVNYRLSPEAKFPAFIEDGALAVAWLQKNAENLGFDRIFLGGHSAGGYLAAMLLMDGSYFRNAGVDGKSIAGGILLSAQMVTHAAIRESKGLSRRNIIVDEAAPLFHLRKETPPLLLLCADKDMPARVEENRLFVAALQGIAGNPKVTLQVLEQRDHASLFTKLLSEGDSAGQLILDFLRTGQLADGTLAEQ
jgi:acetyl esterase/lipase